MKEESEFTGEIETVIENCGTTKIDIVVCVKKLKEKDSDVKSIGGGNYDLLVLGGFLNDVEELNYGVYN